MQIRIDAITMRARVRKNLGDLGSLMQSMKQYGLLNPIVVNQEHELIAGHRRLESAKRLGWTNIDAVVIAMESDIVKLEVEIEENVQRKNLTAEELTEAYDKLEKLRNPGFLKKICTAVKGFFSRLLKRKKD